ncbi:neprilysin-1-like [Amblyomma americanum]
MAQVAAVTSSGDSTMDETETAFVTADCTEVFLVGLGLVCLVALATVLVWYLFFYAPPEENGGRKEVNFTRLLEQSLTRSIPPCMNFYRFVCTGWINGRANSHLSIAETVAKQTMLDARDALQDSARHLREKQAARESLLSRTDDDTSIQKRDNVSYEFLKRRREQAGELSSRRTRQPVPSETRTSSRSAVLKAATMFESCTRVVAEKKSDTEKLAQFMKQYTKFPDVQAADAATLIAIMVELSLTWKLHTMFAVDLFVDHDEDGRVTVHIGKNDELLSWLLWRNILKDSGKLEEFFLMHLAALPGFQLSEAEELSAAISEADSNIIAALYVDERHPEALTYNQLPALVPDVGAQVWVEAVNKQIEPHFRVQREHYVKIGNADALRQVGKLMQHADNALTLFIGWHILRQLAPRASYKAASFVFKDKESYVDDCFRRVVEVMPLAASYPYLIRKPTPSAEAQAKKVIKDLRKEFTAIFKNVPWMDNPTKNSADRKMDAMDEVLIKPVFLVSEDALDQHYVDFATHEDYLTTSLQAARSATRLSVSSLAAGVTSARLSFSPLEVNAFYERELNAMFIAAGIMQSPYLGEKASIAFNYAGLGAVVGHEVMHGFDDRGKDRDAKGRLRDWWSPAVLDSYNDKVECIQKAYGAQQDSSEEIVADFASLPAALGAYRHRAYIQERGQTPTFLEFSGEQIFYLNYCFKLCSRDVTGGPLRQRGHYSTDESRCNVPLRHLIEFADAFDCSPQDEMVASGKCSFWDLAVGQVHINEEVLHDPEAPLHESIVTASD